jgi:hypothetical protein
MLEITTIAPRRQKRALCDGSSKGEAIMADQKQDQGRDRKLVSDEKYEVEYIHKQFPKHSHEAVVKALDACKAQLKGSESREKIMECLKGKLK